MRNDDLLNRAATIASNRDRGASELLALLLPLLGEAIAAGQDATRAVVRIVCAGQPAMAALWNACAAAVAAFETRGRFERVKAEMERAPRALTRVATAVLTDVLAVEAHPHVVTLSYSSSVAAALSAIAKNRPLAVVCGESLPGGEGKRMGDELRSAGADVELVADALLTTYLPASAAVVVGADALSALDWTNKAGTFGLAAAASVLGKDVHVIASREKAQAGVLRERVSLPRLFERTPVALATSFLTDGGVLSPDDVAVLAHRFAPDLSKLLALL